MQVKIFFGEKPVFLCDTLTPELTELLKHPDTVFIDETSTAAIHSLLHEIKKETFHAGILLDHDLDKLQKLFSRQFTVIEAAGGLVQNEEKEILFIYRLGKWDLPKGKIEKKETAQKAATREIEEETGLKKLVLKNKITDTWHTYEAYGKHYLKKTHWYYFTVKKQPTQPQSEEDITEIRWFKTKDIKKPVANTYENIKEILKIFFDTP